MHHFRGGGVWLGLLLILACGGDVAPADDETPPPPDAAPAEMPLALADIAPGDTAAILNLMRHTMSEGDAALNSLERRDTVLSASVADSQRMTLWQAGGTPVKLTWTAPPEPGRVPGEIAVWFVNGEVQVVLEPFDGFFLDADRIILWTDPSLIPHEVSDIERMPREKAVIDSVRARLAVFAVGYP